MALMGSNQIERPDIVAGKAIVRDKLLVAGRECLTEGKL